MPPEVEVLSFEKLKPMSSIELAATHVSLQPLEYVARSGHFGSLLLRPCLLFYSFPFLRFPLFFLRVALRQRRDDNLPVSKSSAHSALMLVTLKRTKHHLENSLTIAALDCQGICLRDEGSMLIVLSENVRDMIPV
jgi:hypothetical protein